MSVLLDVDSEACPYCGGALHATGDGVSEMLDWFRRSCGSCAFAGQNTPVEVLPCAYRPSSVMIISRSLVDSLRNAISG